MNRSRGRTQSCGSDEAKTRVSDAQAQLLHAEMADGASLQAEQKAAVAAAVLAGIAAADAACCKALGERSRSQDHRDAINVVRQVVPGGSEAANALGRLLALKDEAHYGFGDVGGMRLEHAVRWARALVGFAEETLQR